MGHGGHLGTRATLQGDRPDGLLVPIITTEVDRVRVSGPAGGATPLTQARGVGRAAEAGPATPAAGAAPAAQAAAASPVVELSPLERAARNAPAAQAVAAENQRAADSARGDALSADRLP